VGTTDKSDKPSKDQVDQQDQTDTQADAEDVVEDAEIVEETAPDGASTASDVDEVDNIAGVTFYRYAGSGSAEISDAPLRMSYGLVFEVAESNFGGGVSAVNFRWNYLEWPAAYLGTFDPAQPVSVSF